MNKYSSYWQWYAPRGGFGICLARRSLGAPALGFVFEPWNFAILFLWLEVHFAF